MNQRTHSPRKYHSHLSLYVCTRMYVCMCVTGEGLTTAANDLRGACPFL